MISLSNALVLVTGAGGAVGMAVTRGVVAAGGRVVALDVDDDRLAALAGPDVRTVCVDVTAERAWVQVAAAVDDEPNELSGLVTCAAIIDPADGDLATMESSAWRRTLAINLDGCVAASRLAVYRMTKGKSGSIVHVSSIVATRGSATAQLAYTASKGAVSAVAREMAVRYADDGVRVNSVASGLLESPLTADLVSARRELDRRLAHIPMRRLGVPSEVANACLWLLSDASSYVTGTELVVDGGLSASFVTGNELG